MQLGDTCVIALEQRDEILRQPVLIRFGQRTHDAEIQRNKARLFHARGIHPDVAGVCIRMEKIVAKYLLVEQANTFGGELLAVDAGGIDRYDIVATHAPIRAPALERGLP